TVALSWVLGMAAAVALQPSFRGRSLLRTLFLVPYALPAYAGILTWNFMLQRNTRAVNHVLRPPHRSDGVTFWLLRSWLSTRLTAPVSRWSMKFQRDT